VSKIEVRKKTLFISLLFLLSLALLPLASIASARPKSNEQVNVILAGDIASSVEVLDVSRAGRAITVHSTFRGPVTLQFGVATGVFVGGHEGKCAFFLDANTQEALVVYQFDSYDTGEYAGWAKYRLEGNGEWAGDSMPVGIIDASGDFVIYEIHYSSTSKGKSGKSVTSVEYVEVWSGALTFDIAITPI